VTWYLLDNRASAFALPDISLHTLQAFFTCVVSRVFALASIFNYYFLAHLPRKCSAHVSTKPKENLKSRRQKVVSFFIAFFLSQLLYSKSQECVVCSDILYRE